MSFDGCFGWLHQPATGLVANIGVVLCTGLGQDSSSAHRPFRQLANTIAAAGYPSVRFDYPGTGDSADLYDREPWHAWQQSIHQAADWMRKETDVQGIVLVGLRAGAILSALVAEQRHDVVGLVLLEPVLRGRTYINQLSLQANLRRGYIADADRGIELGELNLHPESMRLIQAVDLIGVRLPIACRTAVYATARSSALSQCVEAWRTEGVVVSIQDFGGLEPFLRPSHQTDEPDGDYSRLVCWLNEALVARWHPARLKPPPLAWPMQSEGWVETALRFGVNGQLFGMLCRPRAIQPDLVVVIGNSGGTPHHGFARFSVELARQLARSGIASFRIDFAGLGDSEARDNGVEVVTRVFEADRSSDMRMAVDVLSQLTYKRFVAYGLCSGAFHSLHAALADRRFIAALLVNLPWISLRPDRSGPSSVSQQAIDEIVRRAMHLLLLYGEDDTGLKVLERHFGPRCTGLRGLSGISVQIVAGLDHDLSSASMRTTAATCLLTFLQGVTGGQ